MPFVVHQARIWRRMLLKRTIETHHNYSVCYIHEVAEYALVSLRCYLFF